jgi:hypothetical protein
MAAIGRVKVNGQIVKRESRTSDDGKKEFRSLHVAVVGATLEIRDVTPDFFLAAGPEGGNVACTLAIHPCNVQVANGGKSYGRQFANLELVAVEPLKQQ